MNLKETIRHYLDGLWKEEDGDYHLGTRLGQEFLADKIRVLDLSDREGHRQGSLFIFPTSPHRRISHIAPREVLYLDLYPDHLRIETEQPQVTRTPMRFPSSPTKQDWVSPFPVSITIPGSYERHLETIERFATSGKRGDTLVLPPIIQDF